MILLTEDEIKQIKGNWDNHPDLLSLIKEANKVLLKKIAEHIKNLPTDGHDKWYFYNQELAESLLEETE